MGVFKSTPLSKLAIAVLLNITIAAPSFAYTLNYQPGYITDKQKTEQTRTQRPQQVVDRQKGFQSQVETNNQATQRQANAAAATAVATESNDPIIDPNLWQSPEDNATEGENAAASAADMFADDEDTSSSQVAPAPNITPAQTPAMQVVPRVATSTSPQPIAAPAQKPSVPSYARSPQPQVQVQSVPSTVNNSFAASGENNGFVIPQPKSSVNYGSGNVRTNLHGNAFYTIDSTKQEVDSKAAVQTQSIISNIQAHAKSTEQVSSSDIMSQRLSIDQKQAWKADQERRRANPFGNLFALEDLYNTIPHGSTAYYVRKDIDSQKFLKIMSDTLERYLKDYEVGITILDDRGLVALYNNNDFPLDGIANLQIAYIAGVAMNRFEDKMDMHVRYVATDINRSVYSPFASAALQEVNIKLKKYEELKRLKAEAEARGEPWPPEEEESDDEEGKPKGPPPIVIAKIIQPPMRDSNFLTIFEQQENENEGLGRQSSRAYDHETVIVSDRETKTMPDLISEWNKSEACHKDHFNPKLNVYTSSQLKSLFYYGLNFGDPNAADLLLGYIGSTTALNFELKSKGINHTRYNIQMADVRQSPELTFHNYSPLFDMAKFFAVYIKDKDFPGSVANEIESALDNTVNVKRGIYRGITNSIRNDPDEDYGTLKVHSISGQSGFGYKGLRGVATELAYIEYKGEHYIIAIGIKGVPARNTSELKSNSEKYVSFIANNIFNLLRETYPFLRSDKPILSQRERRRAY